LREDFRFWRRRGIGRDQAIADAELGQEDAGLSRVGLDLAPRKSEQIFVIGPRASLIRRLGAAKFMRNLRPGFRGEGLRRYLLRTTSA
jgi:hypothetical protein